MLSGPHAVVIVLHVTYCVILLWIRKKCQSNLDEVHRMKYVLKKLTKKSCIDPVYPLPEKKMGGTCNRDNLQKNTPQKTIPYATPDSDPHSLN